MKLIIYSWIKKGHRKLTASMVLSFYIIYLLTYNPRCILLNRIDYTHKLLLLISIKQLYEALRLIKRWLGKFSYIFTMLKKAGVEFKKFHALRHTYATKLFEKGVPLKTVQKLLMHSDISITANIYTHVMPEQKIDATEELNDLLS